ncbi:MAG: CPXCG motif-containing cysteine-rich protein [bacterium]|nr:CPXCG motif-containing cysteine-rich protein [bacterium]
MEIEHTFTCPHCWQNISMLLDLTHPEQTYIEDCEVCCNPIRISYTVQNKALTDFSAESSQ